MNQQGQHRERKNAIRGFMREHYTDERLAQLLAHAQDGKLTFWSCCCFIGIVTADHRLCGSLMQRILADPDHYLVARRLNGAYGAEKAFAALPHDKLSRIRLLIPIIRAEMRRRDRMRLPVESITIRPSDVVHLAEKLGVEI